MNDYPENATVAQDYVDYNEYLSVAVSKIKNGFLVSHSGYKNGRHINEQVFAADANAVASIVTDIFG